MRAPCGFSDQQKLNSTTKFVLRKMSTVLYTILSHIKIGDFEAKKYAENCVDSNYGIPSVLH